MSETDADGSFLHEHWNSDLRLFSYDENGAYNLLQVRHIISMFHLFDKLASNNQIFGLVRYIFGTAGTSVQICKFRYSEIQNVLVKP